jgi:CheY-like chemotaxis protein
MRFLRVLLIDDEPDIRELVAIVLDFAGEFLVTGCNTGEEGLAIAAQWHPDLILLDVRMPTMDGLATLGHLQENPRTAATSVVFLTACAQKRELDRFKSLGAAGVITKPFDPMTLAESVRSHIRPSEAVHSQ